MKIVHALWEKRNLDVDCYEITVESHDTPSVLAEDLPALKAEYVVVKVPPDAQDILRHLQATGFCFMELSTTCYHDSQLPEFSPIQNKIFRGIDCGEFAPDDYPVLFDEIASGLFTDDRIARDPLFSIEQANRRYIGWIHDELGMGAKMYKLTYKEAIGAFFVLRDIGNGNHYASIGGVFRSHQRMGLGMLMNFQQIATMKARHGKRVFSAYSSNNRSASSIHHTLGYSLEKQYYVFVKHHPLTLCLR